MGTPWENERNTLGTRRKKSKNPSSPHQRLTTQMCYFTKSMATSESKVAGDLALVEIQNDNSSVLELWKRIEPRQLQVLHGSIIFPSRLFGLVETITKCPSKLISQVCGKTWGLLPQNVKPLCAPHPIERFHEV
jgi:hypothetical protein